MLNKSTLIGILEEKGIITSRSLGQNFLIDQNLLKFIVKTAGLSKDDYALEIGSGPGLLTGLIAQNAKYVWAVEIDKKVFHVSQSINPGLTNVKWINSSILDGEKINSEVLSDIYHLKTAPHMLSPCQSGVPETKLSGIIRNPQLKIISNLPYASSGAIIMALLESKLPISEMTLMMQLEMAQRLTARPKTKEYNAFTILVNLLGAVKIVRKIPPDVFYPKPKVTSALLTIIPYRKPIENYAKFKDTIHTIFRYRRKTIGHILKEVSPNNLNINKILTKTGISPTMRPEEIAPTKYVELAGMLS
ncbi:MAG: ribosomal RNA small subunit methyltransferase A [Planctomycetes bacterium]|nr:ribosomal RNA small subunit methyltransferase A [Planctomycetota bacterium]